MMHQFSVDWVTQHTDKWLIWLGHLTGKEGIHGLEIGTFEGRSARWFLEHILTSSTSRLTCIDLNELAQVPENLAPHFARTDYLVGESWRFLRQFPAHSLDFVYIDGDHAAPFVLEDAILAYRLLKPGGVMIFDDYTWQSDAPMSPHTMPRLAIDSFLMVFSQHIELLGKGKQVAIRKLHDPEPSPAEQEIFQHFRAPN